MLEELVQEESLLPQRKAPPQYRGTSWKTDGESCSKKHGGLRQKEALLRDSACSRTYRRTLVACRHAIYSGLGKKISPPPRGIAPPFLKDADPNIPI